MLVKHVTVENFGSYDFLEMEVDAKGLTLVHGATGSGKSTLPDMVAWVLFGVTAKGGAADDVRRWGSTEVTSGTVVLEGLTVVRKRGKANQNDLFFFPDGSAPVRGKDATDTQRLLNTTLGCDADTYLSASYISEYSPTASFFSAKAKERREVFERVADLSLPAHLLAKTTVDKKEAKKALENAKADHGRLCYQHSTNGQVLARYNLDHEDWGHERLNKIASVERRLSTVKERQEMAVAEAAVWEEEHLKGLEFRVAQLDKLEAALIDTTQADKEIKALTAQLSALRHSRCRECGGPSAGKEADQVQERLNAAKDHHRAAIAAAAAYESAKERFLSLSEATNPHQGKADLIAQEADTLLVRLAEHQDSKNPYAGREELLKAQVEADAIAIKEAEGRCDRFQAHLTAVEQLSELSFTLRGVLLQNAIGRAEMMTNGYLERFFDAELRVTFTIEGGDALAVGITKNGNACVYKQLSKGQRQLLKLSFMIAIMGITADNSAQSFNCLWFDEALDGLDSELKVKALTLFEGLLDQHGSIFLIEHSTEVKALVDNRILVTQNGDVSELHNE